MSNRPIRQQRYRRRRILIAASVLLLLVILVPIGCVLLVFVRGTPQLAGHAVVKGLDTRVEIDRDAQGTPTLIAGTRLDLARGIGFLHGQERFFQMDLLRRVAAGELSGLVGSGAVPIDRKHRLHRFRARAEAILRRMPREHQALIAAYVEGVNAGLAALHAAPFEYTLLGARPDAWQAADTLLVIYAMYFDLQDSTGWSQERLALARQILGRPMADFLYPQGTPADAALDGTMLAEPPMPEALASNPALPAAPSPSPLTHGSNAFAVAGRLTGSGAAIVANDMHLGLNVPNIWYRARMRMAANSGPALDLDGVTLPGTPLLVAGSNGRIAWGFTDSYIATGDLIILEPGTGDAETYLTPSGSQSLDILTERICPIRAACADLRIEESVWGPVVGQDPSGHSLVWRWAAHDANAIDFDGLLALETADSVRSALDAAHRAGMPQQNFVVGDHDGHIGWTIIGQVPKRVGLDDGEPHSWADGSRGWEGYLPASNIPEIVNPPDGIIWTANNRIVGGTAFRLLGDGGYAEAGRARQIRDDLSSRRHFAESDLLAIQVDARAPALEAWQQILVRLLESRSGDPRAAEMLESTRRWGGAASTGSVGYRLVRGFQQAAVRLIYGGFCAGLKSAASTEGETVTALQSSWPSLRLLTERPAHLVPPPYRTWADVDEALVTGLIGQVDREAGGTLPRFTWGARNHVGIHHPLAAFVPMLGWLTDPPDLPIDGDTLQPRVVTPGFGASERLVVSPGHEADGIFEMPVGDAGNPMTPYYLAGERDWVEGRASPFLPGVPRWHLTLEPEHP